MAFPLTFTVTSKFQATPFSGDLLALVSEFAPKAIETNASGRFFVRLSKVRVLEVTTSKGTTLRLTSSGAISLQAQSGESKVALEGLLARERGSMVELSITSAQLVAPSFSIEKLDI